MACSISWVGRMIERSALLGGDVHARRPSTQLRLSRVGVTGVEKVVRVRANGAEQLFYAELECFVDLAPRQCKRINRLRPTKKTCKCRPFRERLKGFEPSTFCIPSSSSGPLRSPEMPANRNDLWRPDCRMDSKNYAEIAGV